MLLSCNDNKERIYFDRNIINELAAIEDSLPSPYTFNMYIKSEKGFCETSIGEMYYRYYPKYTNSYSNFSDFLFDAFNQKLIFPHKECFIPDTIITKEYTTSGIDSLIKKYWKKRKTGKSYELKREIQHTYKFDQVQTIFYYCFLNGYEVYNDDYEGIYSLHPLELEYQ